MASNQAMDRDSRAYDADWAAAKADTLRKRVACDLARQYLGVDRARTRHESICADRHIDNHLLADAHPMARSVRLLVPCVRGRR